MSSFLHVLHYLNVRQEEAKPCDIQVAKVVASSMEWVGGSRLVWDD